jgi:hypothetical protein
MRDGGVARRGSIGRFAARDFAADRHDRVRLDFATAIRRPPMMSAGTLRSFLPRLFVIIIDARIGCARHVGFGIVACKSTLCNSFRNRQ